MGERAIWLSYARASLSWCSPLSASAVPFICAAFIFDFDRNRLQMNSIYQLGMASLLGLATTSSSLLGAAIGLYLPLSKRPLACLLAFAAGLLVFWTPVQPAF